ncbi:hypothetical protein Cni_G11178 [Canna indica]|uniref:Uncharacterized protein n=1 Tax=Canna indica TaxID=4628 RepID=A0AAQ3Q998_9LILI|nr:hypothetical protein Cni_G11178 [Canna indica]
MPQCRSCWLGLQVVKGTNIGKEGHRPAIMALSRETGYICWIDDYIKVYIGFTKSNHIFPGNEGHHHPSQSLSSSSTQEELVPPDHAPSSQLSSTARENGDEGASHVNENDFGREGRERMAWCRGIGWDKMNSAMKLM